MVTRRNAKYKRVYFLLYSLTRLFGCHNKMRRGKREECESILPGGVHVMSAPPKKSVYLS
jgi:hypothetical protein